MSFVGNNLIFLVTFVQNCSKKSLLIFLNVGYEATPFFYPKSYMRYIIRIIVAAWVIFRVHIVAHTVKSVYYMVYSDKLIVTLAL